MLPLRALIAGFACLYGEWTRMYLKITFLLIGILVSISAPAYAQNVCKWDSCNDKAQQAFDSGEYRRAQRQWPKALQLMDTAGQRDSTYESFLKKMWVNLLAVSVKANADGDGNRDAAITVGKMGVTVSIDGQLPAEAYQPLKILLSEMKLLGTTAK
jgi:hypothetical protein